MRATVKIIEVGDSSGFVLSDEMLAHLNVGEGDAVTLIEDASGILLTSKQLLTERHLTLGKEFADEYRDALRALSDSDKSSEGD
ncbi:MAG: AbrB/MazE/SpoVT family DNA-binding domain-containing protein [Rhizomicrobium sp.]|jgi:putative addiction module antidote